MGLFVTSTSSQKASRFVSGSSLRFLGSGTTMRSLFSARVDVSCGMFHDGSTCRLRWHCGGGTRPMSTAAAAAAARRCESILRVLQT